MNFRRLTENDLMLGDWVMVKERKGDDVKDYPIMVHTGTITDIVAGNLIVEPIELTQEIFNKNGFVQDRYYVTLDKGLYWEGYEVWAWNDDSMTKKFVEEYGCYPEENCAFVCNCHYVHELQRLLKIRGINKSIKL
jgi:hypothetical protein